MKKEDFWNLFWLSGMPEAWLMSRPDEGNLYMADMMDKDHRSAEPGLPREARELRLRGEEKNQTE